MYQNWLPLDIRGEVGALSAILRVGYKWKVFSTCSLHRDKEADRAKSRRDCQFPKMDLRVLDLLEWNQKPCMPSNFDQHLWNWRTDVGIIICVYSCKNANQFLLTGSALFE